MEKQKIIIDCDPGHDDVLAICLAVFSGRFDILGLTVVGGNNYVENNTRNTLMVLEHFGLDIKVLQGLGKPIVQQLRPALDIHGETGMDGTSLPPTSRKPLEQNAITWLEETLKAQAEPITLVVLGPMTNIAVLLMTAPEVKSKIKEIVFMGGAVYGGNCVPTAEFNIWQDPEAASVVLSSGIPLVMAGLDVTYKSYLEAKDVEEIKQIGNKASVLAGEILDAYGKACATRGNTGIVVHDAVAVAYLLAPELFEAKDYFVSIDLDGKYTRGCTVTDTFGVTGEAANCSVLLDIDRKAFIDLFRQSLAKQA